MKRIILIAIILTFLTNLLHSEQRDIGLSFKLNKSLALVPFENVQLSDNSDDELKLVEGTFGFAADLFYKSKRRAYFNLSLEYNSLIVNDDFLDINGKELHGSFIKIGFNGISYMDPPDEFTPYVGYGVGVIFINSNQNDLSTHKFEEYEPTKGDLFAEFTLSLDFKAGLLIPINENFSVTTDLDIGVYFAQHLGLIPKLQLGGIYWLE